MIPIYDYYGLTVFFKSDSSLPIHVYGKRGELESMIRISFNNGRMELPLLLDSDSPLDQVDTEVFYTLVDNNSSEIIKKWLDVFLYGKPLEVEIIRIRLRS